MAQTGRNFLSTRGCALHSKVLALSSASRDEPRVGLEQPSQPSALNDPGPSLNHSGRERALRLAERVVLASGIVLFCVLFARLGIKNVLANLRMVGWGIVLILAAEILAFVANTLGWRAAFPAGGRVPSFGQLLLARI